MADGALGDAEFLGGAGDRALPRCRLEGAQRVQGREAAMGSLHEIFSVSTLRNSRLCRGFCRDHKSPDFVMFSAPCRRARAGGRPPEKLRKHKPLRILLINPNSNSDFTRAMDLSVKPLRAQGAYRIDSVTLEGTPRGIETQRDIDSVIEP